jgi:hypothetical protein
MIRILIYAGLTMLSGGLAGAATVALHINSSPLNSPPQPAPVIDATAFVNQSIFNVTTASGLPFQTLNTLCFTNRTTAGQMALSPGYRFDFFSNNVRRAMREWHNSGSITGTTIVLVSATNIVNSGSIHAGEEGLIRLSGENLDLSRGRIRTGQSDNILFGGGSTFGTNYTSALGVTDVYWAVGTNDHVDNGGMAMQLGGGFGLDALSFIPPFLQSPFHQVIDTSFIFGGIGSLFTNLVSVGGFNYGAFAHRAQVGPTNFVIQVVFAPTNNFDTNFTTEVRFYTNFGSGVAIPIVAFKTTDFDIVTLRQNTNAVYLVDSSAFQTNLFLARPFTGGGGGRPRRPSNYELFRTEPFEFRFATNGNTPYTPDLIYNPTYQLTAVTNSYAAYAASLTSSNAFGVTDPTNLVGRVEITGKSINLDQARIRGESTVIIRTEDLSENRVAKVDAPFLNYDLGSVEPQLTISNLASASVRRLSGEVAAWTGRWKNLEVTATATNEIEFHVLIVDNFLNSVAPVIISEFAARAAHVEINDLLNVNKSFAIEATDLNITGGLTLPFGATWAATNVIGVVNFTNSGLINIFQSGFFGEPSPYQTFVNSGSIGASSLLVRALDLQNSGSLSANGGTLTVEADEAVLHGKPTVLFTNSFTNFFGQTLTVIITNSIGATLAADSEIVFEASAASFSNSIIHGRGGITMSVNDSLTDAGQSGINEWTTHGGFHMLALPGTSDLLATHLTLIAGPSEETSHTWTSLDFGASARGYENNLGLGKLTLDGGPFSLFRFAGHGTQCALYVDYLELRNFATNDLEALEIADNLTIYFANASVAPGKIDGHHNGRLRWVKSFAGPLSSTSITYPSGRTYTFNRALVQDKDLDSDGDGIVNGDDPTPIYAEDHVDLRVAFTNAPSRRAVISWYALGGSTSYVEYKTSFNSATWQTLSVVNSGLSAERLTVTDPIPNNMQQRFYRVRVYPPPL